MYDENNLSSIAVTKISVATTNYTEESANEVTGVIHRVNLPSIERVAKEIGDGQKNNFESPIDTSDISITQTSKKQNSLLSSVFKEI